MPTNLDVPGCHPWPSVRVDDDHRPADAAAVARDIDNAVVLVDENAHKLGHPAGAPQFAEVGDEALWS